jgi:hypothetical protein
LVLCLAAFQLKAQTRLSRSGTVSFYSNAPMENIEAHNRQVITQIDLTTGQLGFAILIKAFQFEKQLMHQHFNQDYLESQKYPKANFQGQIQNLSQIDLNRDGSYPVTVIGVLNLHGVSKKITEKGTLSIQGDQIKVNAKFSVLLADFQVKTPAILKDKIAKTVLIEVDVAFN